MVNIEQVLLCIGRVGKVIHFNKIKLARVAGLLTIQVWTGNEMQKHRELREGYVEMVRHTGGSTCLAEIKIQPNACTNKILTHIFIDGCENLSKLEALLEAIRKEIARQTFDASTTHSDSTGSNILLQGMIDQTSPVRIQLNAVEQRLTEKFARGGVENSTLDFGERSFDSYFLHDDGSNTSKKNGSIPRIMKIQTIDAAVKSHILDTESPTDDFRWSPFSVKRVRLSSTSLCSEATFDRKPIKLHRTPNWVTYHRLPSCNRPTHSIRRQGIRNIGNSCYLNAVLQVLFSIDSFAQDISNLEILLDLRESAISYSSFLGLLLQTVKQLRVSTRDSPIDVRFLKDSIGEHNDRFAGYLQQDAHEFMCAFLSLVSDEIRRVIRDHSKFAPAEKMTEEYICRVEPTERAFGSFVSSSLICTKCSYSRFASEKYTNLSLMLPELCTTTPRCEKHGHDDVRRFQARSACNNGRWFFKCKSANCNTFLGWEDTFECKDQALPTISSLLKQFFAPVVNDLRCEKCENSKVLVRSELNVVPRVLLIHLKRFQVRASAGTYFKRKDRIKVDKLLDTSLFFDAATGECDPAHESSKPWCDGVGSHRVSIGNDSANIIGSQSNKSMYELVAVVCHRGGAGIGHYVANVFNSANSTWTLYDDSMNRDITQSEVLANAQRDGYIFAYQLTNNPVK